MTADVVLRWVTTYVEVAAPNVVIEDDGTRVVLFQPSGSEYGSATGRREGPRGRNMLPDGWDGGYEVRTWTGGGCMRVHRVGEPWSTWRWLDPATLAWSEYVYVNLENPWRRSDIGFDTTDWILDLVIGDDGTVVRKDEDELAWALEVGWIDPVFHHCIEDAAQKALDAHRSRAWPFGANWDLWLDRCSAGALPLPATWTENSTRGNDASEGRLPG